MTWKRREHSESFREYELQLVALYTNMLMQITTDQFTEAMGSVFEEYKDQVYTYTRELIKSLRSKDYLIFAISGSQQEIVSKMAAYYGFDDFVGRVDESKEGHFTGKSTTPIFAKGEALKKLIKKHGADTAASYGVGDSHSDIKMMEQVEIPIAFNPEKRLFDQAVKRGWKIVVERKNMIYELERSDGKYQLVKTDG